MYPTAEAPLAHEIQNEQAKLRASICNGIALSILTVGVFVPVIGGIYKWFQSDDGLSLFAEPGEVMFIWLLVAVLFHVAATLFLEGIIEND